MSADDWTTCPRCRANRRALADRAAERAAAAYGEVVADEYAKLLREAEEAALAIDRTFRESYEFFGAAEGTIVALYSGTCTECGLTVSFRYEHPFFPAAT